MIIRRTTMMAIATLFAAMPLTGAGAEDTSISVVGRVRTICDVSLAGGASVPLHEGDNNLGRMTELCNNVDGYRLVLGHPRGLANAFVMLDGQRLPISASETATVIVDSDHPAYAERDLTLVLPETPADGAMPISLYAEPKGVVF